MITHACTHARTARRQNASGTSVLAGIETILLTLNLYIQKSWRYSAGRPHNIYRYTADRLFNVVVIRPLTTVI